MARRSVQNFIFFSRGITTDLSQSHLPYTEKEI